MPAYHYSATREGRHIILSATDENGRTSALFWLKASDIPHLIIRDERLCLLTHELTGFHVSVLVESPEHNAAAMLNAVTRSTTVSTWQQLRIRGLDALKVSAILASTFVVALGVYYALNTFMPAKQYDASAPDFISAAPSSLRPEPTARPVLSPPPAFTTPATTAPDVPSEEKPDAQTAGPSAAQSAAARNNLASVLKRNAERGMFTIALSSGHERTLHAFLDPQCPNCRLMEPALEALSRDFNVVVWPVSVIGGETSSQAVAPLLCEKDPQKRIAGWQGLYAADNGMKPKDAEAPAPDEACLRAAAAAIDVNNLAFRQFGFTGTPWVISDTGWHLPTGLLTSPGTVKLFLNTTDKGTPDDEKARR